MHAKKPYEDPVVTSLRNISRENHELRERLTASQRAMQTVLPYLSPANVEVMKLVNDLIEGNFKMLGE